MKRIIKAWRFADSNDPELRVNFCLLLAGEDISLRSSWHDFEAGIAKCTGNDGP